MVLKVLDTTRKHWLVRIVLLMCLLLLAGCTTSSTTPTPPGGGELTTYQMEIDLLGTRHEASVGNEGRVKAGVQMTSADGTISLSIDRDTILLDKDGKPLQFIHTAIDPTLPLPPEDAYIVGAVYDLIPKGATFNPPLKLTISYDPEELPENTRESDIYIAPYNEDTGWGRWSYMRVDTESHRATTHVYSLARFAVLAPRELTPPKPDLVSIPLEQALSSDKPTLAEFGWRTCVPCKQMKPILEELAVEYEDKLNVVIVEVYEQKELTQQYGIMAIPTQIFFDGNGKEVTRHMGFWSKEEIIAQLKKMGVD